MGLVVYNVAWAEAYLRTKWHLDPSGRLATTDVGRKLGAVPLWGRGAGSPSNNVARAEAYLPTKWHLNPSSHLATTDMGRKLGAPPTFLLGELGPHLTQCGLGRGLPPYQVASLSIQPFSHNRHGPKIGGYALFWGELGPHVTQCSQGRGLPPYQVTS